MARLTIDQSRQLDSIRGLSALVVLIGHGNQIFILPTQSWTGLYVGFFTQMAVMVFFVLSGFLIGKSILNNCARNSHFNIWQYAVGRMARLYPPLIASIMLVIGVYFLAPYVFPSGSHHFLEIDGMEFVRRALLAEPKRLFGTLIFLNEFKTSTPTANGPLWSLSYEFWYYAIAGAIFTWPSRKALAGIMMLTVVMVVGKNPLFFMLAPIWFSGLLLALVHNYQPQLQSRIFRLAFTLFSTAMAVCIWRVLKKPVQQIVWLDPMNHFRLVSGLWFASFLALLLNSSMRFTSLFAGLAPFSYTLYVTHFPIMLLALGALQKMIAASTLLALAVGAGAIIISLVFSFWLSKRVEQKGKFANLLGRLKTGIQR